MSFVTFVVENYALATTALVIIAMLLAIALFVAGAMWRARVA